SKPAGLPTLPGAGFLERTLLHRVRCLDPEAVPMHRLGRHTSGLVLCACTPRARSRLAHAWRTGRVVKRYRALAAGSPAAARFAVAQPI
ncbi:MAG: RNA pseudouridine synthase, partial [Gammaproteobacteria bacterium]|nr:RNA pseudouridine synthase [Gammaproteobacteria bacterium]